MKVQKSSSDDAIFEIIRRKLRISDSTVIFSFLFHFFF